MKSSRVLNLDLNKMRLEDLAQLTHIIEDEMTKHLNEVLGLRLTDFNITIGAEVKEEELIISVDVEVKAYFTDNLNLEAILDSALRRAFNAAEQFLARYRTGNKHVTVNSESCNCNSR
uniref:DUF3194 domain-containing protein n=1 Tax=Ignisphaera aggregans TaxID=334771 RepID=A0A7J2TZV0_9CREN